MGFPPSIPVVPLCPSRVEWWHDFCDGQRQPGTEWALALSRVVEKKRGSQGNQRLARDISYFLKPIWFLLDFLYLDGSLTAFVSKGDDLTNSREPSPILLYQSSGAPTRGTFDAAGRGESFTLTRGSRVLEGGGLSWDRAVHARDVSVTGGS